MPLTERELLTAKLLQSCDPIDRSPPGSPVPGILQQEHWSGLPFPSLVHEREKWKWSLSVVSDSSRSQGLQPTRLLRPWDFPGKSTGVGCHCLLHVWYWMVTNISNHLYTQRLEIRHTSLNTIMHTLIHQRGCEPQVFLILQIFNVWNYPANCTLLPWQQNIHVHGKILLPKHQDL